MHNIHATGIYTQGTNGTSNGIVPMLRVFNDTARYVDKGGGKRKGAFAMYLDPWHADFLSFWSWGRTMGRKKTGHVICFLHFTCQNSLWKGSRRILHGHCFVPMNLLVLLTVGVKIFEKMYMKYEPEGKEKKVVQEQKLCFYILEVQIEKGNPYILFKDTYNKKSNQQNLEPIKSSNLCIYYWIFKSKILLF